jgi:hypothetical protein
MGAHLARKYTERGSPKPYSQLVAIHVGLLLEGRRHGVESRGDGRQRQGQGSFCGAPGEGPPHAAEKYLQKVAQIKAKEIAPKPKRW